MHLGEVAVPIGTKQKADARERLLVAERGRTSLWGLLRGTHHLRPESAGRNAAVVFLALARRLVRSRHAS